MALSAALLGLADGPRDEPGVPSACRTPQQRAQQAVNRACWEGAERARAAQQLRWLPGCVENGHVCSGGWMHVLAHGHGLTATSVRSAAEPRREGDAVGAPCIGLSGADERSAASKAPAEPVDGSWAVEGAAAAWVVCPCTCWW